MEKIPIHLSVFHCRFIYLLGSFPFRALQFGNQYIYQAMPRMLSLWLDFGARVCECEKSEWSKE